MVKYKKLLSDSLTRHVRLLLSLTVGLPLSLGSPVDGKERARPRRSLCPQLRSSGGAHEAAAENPNNGRSYLNVIRNTRCHNITLKSIIQKLAERNSSP